MIVMCQVGRRFIECSQSGIKRRFVPHVKELRGAVVERLWLEAEILDRSAKGLLELGEVAVNFHLLGSAGGQAANARGEPGPSRTGAE